MKKVVDDTSNDVSNNKKMILDDSKGANTASNEQGTGLTRNTIVRLSRNTMAGLTRNTMYCRVAAGNMC